MSRTASGSPIRPEHLHSTSDTLPGRPSYRYSLSSRTAASRPGFCVTYPALSIHSVRLSASSRVVFIAPTVLACLRAAHGAGRAMEVHKPSRRESTAPPSGRWVRLAGIIPPAIAGLEAEPGHDRRVPGGLQESRRRERGHCAFPHPKHATATPGPAGPAPSATCIPRRSRSRPPMGIWTLRPSCPPGARTGVTMRCRPPRPSSFYHSDYDISAARCFCRLIGGRVVRSEEKAGFGRRRR